MQFTPQSTKKGNSTLSKKKKMKQKFLFNEREVVCPVAKYQSDKAFSQSGKGTLNSLEKIKDLDIRNQKNVPKPKEF